jgi:S1-C subfamily serine protease
LARIALNQVVDADSQPLLFSPLSLRSFERKPMMFKVEGHKLRSYLFAFGLACTAAVGFLPATPVIAQTRGLPDFADLVEQVGPAVVGIRTIEKVSARGGGSGSGEMDEEMQEFFRRFFGQPSHQAIRVRARARARTARSNPRKKSVRAAWARASS